MHRIRVDAQQTTGPLSQSSFFLKMLGMDFGSLSKMTCTSKGALASGCHWNIKIVGACSKANRVWRAQAWSMTQSELTRSQEAKQPGPGECEVSDRNGREEAAEI